jgi:multimeric flavodoxin WrbA
MKITVLNGSPKGDVSVTMQYVRYLHKEFPDHTVSVHNISHKIKVIEKEEKAFREIIGDVRSADLVLWAFPLYYLTVASQYKRFIELVYERKAGAAFKSRFAAVFTTSIHFFDHTAHNYMRAVCDDLGMKFAGAYSASMYDLVRSDERARFRAFVETMFETVRNDMPAARAYPPLKKSKFAYRPARPKAKVDTAGKTILIMNDASGASSNLGRMVARLHDSFAGAPAPVNIRELDVGGGCLGCIQCGYDNTCVYGDSDAFHEFFETRVRPADIIFYCFETRDRYCSALWKRFIDRGFYNNHVPTLAGKQLGYVVSGPLSELDAFREFIRAYPDYNQANCAGIVTDEYGDSKEIDRGLDTMAASAVSLSIKGYIAPRTFLSIGGRKLFRDDIWSWMSFPFVADHRFYKKNGIYDFPKRFTVQRMVNAALRILSRMRGFREVVYKQRIKNEMLKPFKRYVDN